MYVNDVDLNKHCKPCLKGYTSKKITKWTRHEENVCLDESEAKYYYLCGGSYPYKWENNFHLAWKEKSGASFEYSFNGITIRLKNAERIEFSEDDIEKTQKYADNPEYYTCRNWQFANKVKYDIEDSAFIKNEKHYPLTKEKFYKKVEELLNKQYSKEDLDYVTGKLDELWETEPLFMESLYGFACFTYDNPSLYGENCKKAFEDGYIKQNAVRQIRLMIG